ncbi:MAG: hypothetical protein ABI596_03450 [Pyrinomonadaceae bacterium]
MDNAQLKLDYAFTSDPNPIRVSASGFNSQVNLDVMIDNPGPAVTVEKLTIQIPMGTTSGNALSTSPNLPSPVVDPAMAALWNITTDGSLVTIQPQAGTAGEITEPIAFTLPNIAVNEAIGIVPITITEYGAAKLIDADSYRLEKLAADFPVAKFYANPNVLYDLDQTATLYWECSEQGQQNKYLYSLRSVDNNIDPGYPWQPDDCLNSGTCFSCSDGVSGQTPPPLTQTTTFALDVIKVDPAGGRDLYKSLPLTVRVEVPSIADNSYQKQSPSGSGRIAVLHWIARNASKCSLSLDNKVIAPSVPTDTYHRGYTAALTGDPGTHQLAITAYARAGTAQRSFPFLSFNTGPAVSVPVGAYPMAIAVTPDGTLALVVNMEGNSVSVINLAQGRVTQSIPASTRANNNPSNVATTPDGKLALVTNNSSQDVAVIDIATLTREPQTISIGTEAGGIAITPDSSLALVVGTDAYNVTIIDIQKRAVANVIGVGETPWNVAITPDGALGLVTNGLDGTVSVIDIPNRRVADLIGGFQEPTAIAITPDGLLALVTNLNSQTVAIVDIARRQILTSIGLGANPFGIAITPDGTLAFVTTFSNNVLLIDIAGRALLPGSFATGQRPNGIAVTPDGTLLLVTNASDNTVSII